MEARTSFPTSNSCEVTFRRVGPKRPQHQTTFGSSARRTDSLTAGPRAVAPIHPPSSPTACRLHPTCGGPELGVFRVSEPNTLHLDGKTGTSAPAESWAFGLQRRVLVKCGLEMSGSPALLNRWVRALRSRTDVHPQLGSRNEPGVGANCFLFLASRDQCGSHGTGYRNSRPRASQRDFISAINAWNSTLCRIGSSFPSREKRI